MSYLDEIISIGRMYQYGTSIAGDTEDTVGPTTSDKSIWTLIGKTRTSFKRNVKTCCISPSGKRRCTVDVRKLISRSMITNVPLEDKHYSWEQYDISIFCKGFITEADNVIGGAVITRPVTIKQTTGSIARVLVPGTGATTLSIKVNSITFGTIHYPGGTASGVITITNKIELNDGDIINIVSTDTFDSATKDYVITLSGIAQNVILWDSEI